MATRRTFQEKTNARQKTRLDVEMRTSDSRTMGRSRAVEQLRYKRYSFPKATCTSDTVLRNSAEKERREKTMIVRAKWNYNYAA